MEVTAAAARQPCAAFTLESLELEVPRSNEVIVEIAGVGRCHTDAAFRDGVMSVPHPIVPLASSNGAVPGNFFGPSSFATHAVASERCVAAQERGDAVKVVLVNDGR
jgi:hypothetical protein